MNGSVYLTFDGNCAEAFDFYKEVFNLGDFKAKMTYQMAPFKDQIPQDMHDRILHVSLPLSKTFHLMGCDKNPVMHKKDFVVGTNSQVALSPTTKVEADRIYNTLMNDGGSGDNPMKDMFWESYFGTCTDKFGVQWMIDCVEKASNDGAGIEDDTEEVPKVANTVEAAAAKADEGEPPAKKIKA
jgi:PhnB protein